MLNVTEWLMPKDFFPLQQVVCVCGGGEKELEHVDSELGRSLGFCGTAVEFIGLSMETTWPFLPCYLFFPSPSPFKYRI